MESLLYSLVKKRAHEKFIGTNTIELALECGISQQTASRKLIEMEKDGLIERRVDVHGQSIRLTQKAIAELKNVYRNLRPVFDSAPKKIVIEGRVFSGLGEGGFYVTMPGYRKQFVRKLGFDPYPGTLNVRLGTERDIDAKSELDGIPAVQIEGFTDAKRTYGGASCYKATINGVEAAVLVIERTHHPADVIEIISPHFLRKKLKLKDGSEVKILLKNE
ncbi:MAG: CTP-dependent riboflavin kinase [Candidatus Aenigmarchaeota archaeon]|nr:CTP-dependent riboflavin kinase [Candidatus Aenigmarchaeota archaeon]